jgi:hypothetical protein
MINARKHLQLCLYIAHNPYLPTNVPTEGPSPGMYRRSQRQRNTGETSDAIWTLALTLTVTLLLTACLATMCFLQLEEFGPQIGAIVVFKPGIQSLDLWQLSVSTGDTIGTAPARACTLSPGVMATGGGSLVVEARQMTTPPIYRVHWAGQRTSDGSADCGKQADLILSRTDLQKLANTAGGFGPKTLGP